MCKIFLEPAGVKEIQTSSQPMIDLVLQGKVIPQERKKELDNAVIDFIIMDEQAINVVEGSGFQNLMKKFVPYYKVPSRYLVMKEMNVRLEKRNSDLIKLLDSALYVILVIDGWSSRTMESYIGLVAHLIMPNGDEKVVALACRHFPERHTDNNLAEWFKNQVETLGIMSKLVRIGTDSVANMLKAFRDIEFDDVNEMNDEDEDLMDVLDDELLQESVLLLGGSLDSGESNDSLIKELRCLGLLDIHFRCVIHVLQLAIKDFVKYCPHREFDKAIGKAKSFTKFVRKSSIDSELCKAEKVTLHGMNETRWNSMYIMVDSILKAHAHDGFLERLNASEKYKFRASDINMLRELHEVLRPLKEFTDQMQANSFTMGLMLKGYEIVQVLLQKIIEDRVDIVVDLQHKLEDRLGKIMKAPQARLSAVFDPRTAYRALQNQYNKDLVLKAMNIVIELSRKSERITSIEMVITQPNKKNRASFWDKVVNTVEKRLSMHSNDNWVVQEGSPEDELAKFTKEVYRLEMQLAINSLKWWVEKQYEYPTMFKIAFLYLFGPVGTASVERLFSLTGRLCRSHISSMNAENVEMLALLKSGVT